MDKNSIVKHAMMFDTEDFPDVMCDFAEIGGIVNTLLYAHEFGGVEFYLKRWKQGETPSREIMNMLQFYRPKHVEEICAMYGGERVHIKKCSALIKKIRDAEILSLNNAGASKVDVARHTKTSVRHVRKVCNG